jgi:hypothetical protein
VVLVLGRAHRRRRPRRAAPDVTLVLADQLLLAGAGRAPGRKVVLVLGRAHRRRRPRRP